MCHLLPPGLITAEEAAARRNHMISGLLGSDAIDPTAPRQLRTSLKSRFFGSSRAGGGGARGVSFDDDAGASSAHPAHPPPRDPMAKLAEGSEAPANVIGASYFDQLETPEERDSRLAKR